MSDPTAVVLHAHPDDEAIFTGATIRTLVDAGVRVVLVTATCGEEGVPRVPLYRGETMRQRRVAELERACELLGVARLELLGHRDSGAGGGPYRRAALGAQFAERVADRVAALAAAEGAQALFHYDPRGIYGHIDHVQVHRIGARVVDRLGITGYEATVDAAVLRSGPRHVLASAAGEHLDVGVPPEQISLRLEASPATLLAKLAAMSAHASQIGPEYLEFTDFAAAYGQEWFVRRGAPGLVDAVLAGARSAALVPA